MKHFIARNDKTYVQYFIHIGAQKKQYLKKKKNYDRNTSIYTKFIESSKNTNTIVYILKKHINIINSIFLKGGCILINVKNNIECFNSFLRNKHERNTNCIIIPKWINGILTNKKTITTRAKAICMQHIRKKSNIDTDFRRALEIQKMVYLPQLLFLINKNKSAIHESSLLNIPNICILKDIDNETISYNLQGTQNTIWNTYMYVSFIFSVVETHYYKRYKHV